MDGPLIVAKPEFTQRGAWWTPPAALRCCRGWQDCAPLIMTAWLPASYFSRIRGMLIDRVPMRR
jgi:hypothetical protein